MDKASAYGAGDCRFESYRGHFSSAPHRALSQLRGMTPHAQVASRIMWCVLAALEVSVQIGTRVIKIDESIA